jgi:ATP-dependent DNA helicase RecG
MQSSFDKLIRILLLEEKSGCANRSVIGGLERFAPYWKVDALSQVSSDSLRSVVERTAKCLESYPSIEAIEQRQALINDLVQQLREAEASAREACVAAPPVIKPTLSKPCGQPLAGHVFSPTAQHAAAQEPANNVAPLGAEPPSANLPSLHKPACKATAENGASPPPTSSATPEPSRHADKGAGVCTPPDAEEMEASEDAQETEREPSGVAEPAPTGAVPAPDEEMEDEALPRNESAGWHEGPGGFAVVSSDDLDEEERATPTVSKPVGSGRSSAQQALWSRRAGVGLDSPITCLPSVGEVQARRLAKLDIQTIRDLLYLFPRRYDDYSRLSNIRQLEFGEEVTIIANVIKANVRQSGPNRSIVKCSLSDGTGTLEVTWFNQPFLAGRLQAARQIVVSGRVEQYLGRPTMTSPEWEPLDKDLIHTGRLAPVYPLTEGVTNRWLRRLIKRTVEYWAERIEDYVPSASRERRHLSSLGWALQEIHFPANSGTLSEARRRLTFDEFLLLQLGVLRQRGAWRAQTGRAIPVDQPALEQFLAGLPYALTGAQSRALAGVLDDLAQAAPMNRLLQGDVGSGKTVVAAAAALATIQAGFQVALMAPTEILAEQHAKSIERLFAEARISGPDGARPVAVRLLTGSLKPAERDAVAAEIAAGQVDLAIGTHALIQEGVQFERLALVIVDEQHRFGVRQRAALRGKGYNPHLLVMTATPIPRTLSLTLFGDLDVSVIDELPPGRQTIQTYLVTDRERERAYRFVRKQVAQGHQAFIICPLVEESDKIDARSAIAEHERLQRSVFPDLRLGLLHGRMKGDEKEDVMRRFAAGELHVLVSTAVVEVGIDVPNATVILIEGAERFGLAQLHQFRGRVGRGPAPSYCLLASDSDSEEGATRLQALAESQDGFALAEMDLKMRGPGEFFGTRQSGLPDLRLAQLADVRQLESARAEAETLLAEDGDLSRPEHAALRSQVETLWACAGDPS